jgi:hypothetical protein
MSTHSYDSRTLQIFHVNLLFTEAVFSAYADNSLRTGCELTRTKLANLHSSGTLFVLYWRCTAFSLSYKHLNLTCGERSAVYCCAWRHWGHVVPHYCCATQQLPRNPATREANRGEGRGGKTRQRCAIVQSCSLTFLNFSSSHMGWLRHTAPSQLFVPNSLTVCHLSFLP